MYDLVEEKVAVVRPGGNIFRYQLSFNLAGRAQNRGALVGRTLLVSFWWEWKERRGWCFWQRSTRGKCCVRWDRWVLGFCQTQRQSSKAERSRYRRMDGIWLEFFLQHNLNDKILSLASIELNYTNSINKIFLCKECQMNNKKSNGRNSHLNCDDCNLLLINCCLQEIGPKWCHLSHHCSASRNNTLTFSAVKCQQQTLKQLEPTSQSIWHSTLTF